MFDVIQARGRIGTQLASSVDAEGRQIKFDIREDEEQTEKLVSTIELLVAAGYFRARIKGLSAFDKIVGGMAWCISLCDFDLDVDILYQDNATIGQKIALTEKIVYVLPKMKCPYTIEPHQIQGLDMLRIFPVIQFLVKSAIERKEELSDQLRSFATSQFDTRHSSVAIQHSLWMREKPGIVMADEALRELFAPKRRYKRQTNEPIPDERRRVLTTLAEYSEMKGRLAGGSRKPRSDSHMSESSDAAEEAQIHELLGDVSETTELKLASVAAFVDTDAIQQAGAFYLDKDRQLAGLVPQLTSAQAKQKYLEKLRQQTDDLVAQADELRREVEGLQTSANNESTALASAREEDDRLNAELERLREVEESIDPNHVATVKGLMSQHAAMKAEEQQFKQRCKEELAKLQTALENAKVGQPVANDEEAMHQLLCEQESVSNDLQTVRLKMAKKNRKVAALQRKIDEVPSRAELNQYQRRFLELYNQIITKHKETKQYYILYNTQQDIKTCMEKEAGLLDSIFENYQEAMSSDVTKQQFVQQLEQILDGVHQNQLRAEKRNAEERAKRDRLRDANTDAIERQRLYFRTVKEFQEACRQNDNLQALLQERNSS